MREEMLLQFPIAMPSRAEACAFCIYTRSLLVITPAVAVAAHFWQKQQQKSAFCRDVHIPFRGQHVSEVLKVPSVCSIAVIGERTQCQNRSSSVTGDWNGSDAQVHG